MVEESKFETIERLKQNGDFRNALVLIDSAMVTPMDADSRRRFLINLVVCAANLLLDERGTRAIAELDEMPPSPMWDISKNLVAASFHMQFNRYEDALRYLDKNLHLRLLNDPEFANEKYETTADFGLVLAHLGRDPEALVALREAEKINSKGCRRVWVKIEISACLRALGRLDEAFAEANAIVRDGDSDLVAFALYRMANIRLLQAKYNEAVRLYADVKTMLPSDFVSIEDVEKGIAEALKGSNIEASMKH